jgi:hypothetical protein
MTRLVGAPALAVITDFFLLVRELLLFTEFCRELAKLKSQEIIQALKGIFLRVQDLLTHHFIADDLELVVFDEIGQKPWVFGEALLCERPEQTLGIVKCMRLNLFKGIAEETLANTLNVGFREIESVNLDLTCTIFRGDSPWRRFDALLHR